MSIEKKKLKGGYRFTGFKGSPTPELVDISLPDQIVIPFKQGYGAEATPLVMKGDAVNAGQIIGGNDDRIGSPVHSSVNGTVEDIKPISHNGGEVAAAIITPDSGTDVQLLSGHTSEWRLLQAETIEELVYLSGAGALGSNGIPTRYGSASITVDDVDTLIIHGVEDELLGPSLDVFLDREGLDSFIEGIRILQKIFPRTVLFLAFNRRNKNPLSKLAEAFAGETGVHLTAVPDRYPQSKDEILVQTLLGTPFPYGKEAASIGAVILDTPTVLHIRNAVVEGQPVIEKTLALGGAGFAKNPHIRCRVGTPYRHILSEFLRTDTETRTIKNSLLTGNTLEDAELPVVRNDSALFSISEIHDPGLFTFAKPGFGADSYSKSFIAAVLPFAKSLDTNIHGEARACLSCSFCSNVCPVGILPNLLHRYVQRDIIQESLLQFGIFNCIDCNLCTYVCPSKIPVAQLIKQGKEQLRAEGITNEQYIKTNFVLKGMD